MTTAMPTPPVDERFVLYDVDWAFYESLLERVGDRHVFITYDSGRLELMSPSFTHDKRARFIGLLVNILAEELGIRIQGGGSTTFRRRDLDKGLEPDQCFYVGNVQRIIGKDEIDLSVDPPPDIAIEVEISRRIVDRVAIYQSLGVPELWRDDGLHLRMFGLGPDSGYRERERSVSFPMLSAVDAEERLALANAMDEMTWTRTAREWVRKNLRR